MRVISKACLLFTFLIPLASSAQQPPLYDDLGDHHYTIGTEDPMVQAYFDQGLRLYYAFNHAEAVRAFRAAQQQEPDCAMCFWGEALAWGPNINLPMDEPSGIAAYEAIQKALAIRDGASPRESALIEALAVRYVAEPPSERAYLDRIYAEAMSSLVVRFPDDLDIQVLFAEALLDLRPWDYWDEDGIPQAGIHLALAALERVIDLDESHPGACHFYIHAVEAIYPERAIPCAERLANLMPGAGHLVHMPGHIYIRVGRYLDAIEANEHAVHADESYIVDQRPEIGMYTAGYYPHNYDFLAFAAMMIGRQGDAVAAAEKVATLLPTELFGAPGMDFLQHWMIRPLLVQIRFSDWDSLLERTPPSEEYLHSRAMWHYARGRALAATGDTTGASNELMAVQEIARSPAMDGLRMEYNLSTDLLAIAEHTLAGQIDATAGQFDSAIMHLQQAVRLEDALLYGEPPEWTVPARQELGMVLLRAERFNEAERLFQEDLDRFPGNGWSLGGLVSALRAQNRDAEANSALEELRSVWSTADLPLPVL